MRPIVFLTVILLFSETFVSGKGNIVFVKQKSKSGKSFEKRCYIKDKLIYLVAYSDSKHKDSVHYNYDGLVVDPEIYYSKNNKYIRYSEAYNELYKQAYFEDILNNECTDLFSINSAAVIIDDINNICFIRGALIPTENGMDKTGASCEKDYSTKIGKVISFDSLNANFVHYPFSIGTDFDNGILQSVKIEIENNCIKKSEYHFNIGTMKRAYFYEKGKIKKILICVKLDGVDSDCNSYEYTYL